WVFKIDLDLSSDFVMMWSALFVTGVPTQPTEPTPALANSASALVESLPIETDKFVGGDRYPVQAAVADIHFDLVVPVPIDRMFSVKGNTRHNSSADCELRWANIAIDKRENML